MELKIMEWDHPLSYFQWSGPLWSSFEFRKFSIGLQKQNSCLFSQAPFSFCFCRVNSNTLHQPQPCASNHIRSYLAGTSWCSHALLSQMKWVLPISKSFPIFPLPAQVPSSETPPHHSADPYLPQSPALSHCLPIISLAWISFPCIPFSLLASFGLSPILHLPHHPGFLNFFFKLVWRVSISPSHLQLPQSPLLHAFRSGFQLEWYSYRLSLSQDKSRSLWAKSGSDMHQLGSPDFRGRLQAPSSWAAHRQLRPRGWLHHITLRAEKFSLPQ